MMKQYLEIKNEFRDDILFFRMGDFYEMFFDDAHIASKILGIALTSRQNDVPMCGIPYHAAESYIARLIRAGKRVAVCEQMEATPSSGTVVRREVVRIITPGTVIESNLLLTDDNNFLASVVTDKKHIALAFVDVSTGEFYISVIPRSYEMYRGEMIKYAPREVVFREGPDDDRLLEYLRGRDIPVIRLSDWLYDRDYLEKTICSIFRIDGISGLGLEPGIETIAAGSILHYLKDTHRRELNHLMYPRRMKVSDRMVLDEATISNLELVTNLQDGTKNRTLFATLDRTKSPMGRRALERHILQPLLETGAIVERLDAVQYFFEYHDLTAQVQERLSSISDLERLFSRFSLGKSFPRNFISLMQSIRAAHIIRMSLEGQPHDMITRIAGKIPDMRALADRIASTIDDEPALSPDHGRVIRRGYSEELDRIYELKENAREWILAYQEEEKARLGLSTLRIRYNKIIGYYIELSKGQAGQIPAEYFRKQTLVGTERFTTEKLQNFETEILSASERIRIIENREIEALTAIVIENKNDIQDMAKALGEIDFLCSLALSAIENNYSRPVFSNDGTTQIHEARHPVVEKFHTREVFVPNDITLDGYVSMIKIITGPNMAGKSTYIRMAAVIQLMAQTGSFVPAASARVSPVDRIFTRIGASDNISRGESTFLVEMNETANILNNATSRSLVIMDEVGRGTSTYDGLSIAWSIIEYIARYIKCRTLFATHYHELTQLGGKRGVINYTVLVKEGIAGVEFLHRVVQGSADKSYGIHVARRAGIPKPIIERAERILARLEKGRSTIKPGAIDEESAEQLEIFNASNHIIVQTIMAIDTDSITPIEALNELHRLKKMID